MLIGGWSPGPALVVAGPRAPKDAVTRHRGRVSETTSRPPDEESLNVHRAFQAVVLIRLVAQAVNEPAGGRTKCYLDDTWKHATSY